MSGSCQAKKIIITTNLRIFGVRMRRQRQVQVWFQCFLEMVNMSCLLF
ncbi:BnaC02g09570D [Brassica napus]|uniref:BnaC02g09570D protein n=1 Tax=Brassica napus TaxID=3708 RepID=A0A078HDA4_BRANA|nr:BnaC02g09570D [Brassica napus]